MAIARWNCRSCFSRFPSHAFFWLDGHSDKTPIMDELRAVFTHGSYKHAILIDDANCFGSSQYYPTMDAVRELTARLWPEAMVEVRDNIIRIYPS